MNCCEHHAKCCHQGRQCPERISFVTQEETGAVFEAIVLGIVGTVFLGSICFAAYAAWFA